MQVHEKVYKYIIENGIKQNSIAQKCNMSAHTFSAMMHGKRKMYAEDLRAICYALEISPEEFIEYYKREEVKNEILP